MRNVKSELEDKGKFEVFLNILSEEEMENLFDYNKLHDGYIDNDSFYTLIKYDKYKESVLAQYIDPRINKLYQNFNKSFTSVCNFVNKYFIPASPLPPVGKSTEGYTLDPKTKNLKMKRKKLRILAIDFGKKYKFFIEKTNKYLSHQQENHEIESIKKTGGLLAPAFIIEGKFAYLKIKRKKIKIGNIQNAKRKCGLMKALLGDCFGKKRSIEVIFEFMELPKDQNNSQLQDDYTALNLKKEIIRMTWKEIQRDLNKNKLNKVFTLHIKGNVAQFAWI